MNGDCSLHVQQTTAKTSFVPYAEWKIQLKMLGCAPNLALWIAMSV